MNYVNINYDIGTKKITKIFLASYAKNFKVITQN